MKLIIYVIVLLLAILIGLMIKIDPGYVLIAYHHWTAEMPLWFAVIAIAIIFLLFHYGIRIWIAIANIGERWHIWKIKRLFYREHPLTNSGFINLISDNWGKLLQSLSQIKKLRLIPNEVYAQLETKIYSNLIIKQNNLHSLKKLWRSIPNASHKKPKIIYAYAESLLKFNENEVVANALEKQLKSSWNESLIKLYGMAKTKHSLKQLRLLENFISGHRHNPELLLALGRISARCKLWAKSDEYLSMHLRIAKNPAVYSLLGYVREQQGESSQATEMYHQSALNDL